MKKFLVVNFLLVIAVITGGILADEQNPWDLTDSRFTVQLLFAQSDTTLPQKLQQIDTQVASNFSELNEPISDVSGYAAYRAHCDQARTIVEKKAGDPASQHSFEACSLLALHMLYQVQIQKTNQKIDSLHQQHTSVFGQLHAAHEQINAIQKTKANQLKLELDHERVRAEKIKKEAEMRFNELRSELIKVSQDARGTIISMSDLLFDVGKATLKENLRTNLAKIAGILTVYKDVSVTVEGHTDNTGSYSFNQSLSEQRAENVMDFLIQQGVARQRLTAVGYGFQRPIADNATAEGRQKNRRVDLIISEN